LDIVILRGFEMKYMTELKANLGIVLRGDFVELRTFLVRLDGLLDDSPDVKLVHKQVSASKLWLKEGSDMNDKEQGRV
jgi:hypothetical protein